MQNDLLMIMKLYKIVCDSLVFSILAYLVCLSDSHVYYLSISMMHHNYASLGWQTTPLLQCSLKYACHKS